MFKITGAEPVMASFGLREAVAMSKRSIIWILVGSQPVSRSSVFSDYTA